MLEEIREQLKMLKEEIQIGVLAAKCFIMGDDWENSKWYAEKIVKGWRKNDKNSK